MWLSVGLAYLGGKELGSVTLFWGNRLRTGDTSSIPGMTPRMEALSDTLANAKTPGVVGVIAAIFIAFGLPDDMPGWLRFILAALGGVAVAAPAGFASGYWNWKL